MMILRFMPLILILLPPVAQIIFSAQNLNRKIKTPLWLINLLVFISGLVLPVLATIISMATLPAGIKCATGCIGFAFLGWMINVTIVPIIAACTYMASPAKKEEIIPNSFNH